VFQRLDRVRQAAKAKKREKSIALLHHVDAELLGAALSWLKRDAAPGIGEETWQEYKHDLEANLTELHAAFIGVLIGRFHRGGST
jgi:hypothetical protein